jgi:uncharacterized membrane protein YhaH (DUF805 family)
VTGRIFINYRRGDSQGAAGRLYDRLLTHFDRERLFMDVDAIEPGVDFVKTLDEQLSSCSAFIAVIGPGWLAARNSNGNPRLDNPNDYVRMEIESALKRDVRVIPVLVDGADMPQPTDLPPSLEPLSRRNAIEIAHHRFAADCDDLARVIKRALGIEPAADAAAQPYRPPSWAEIFFSFKGRISRKHFLIGALITLGLGFAFGAAILATVGFLLGGEGQAPEIAQKLKIVESRLTTIVEISVWWPSWALTIKRLHDFDHGWKTLMLFVAADVASVVFELMDKNDVSGYLQMFVLGITLMLAAVKGTTGPNEYGPDPLAKPPKAA